MTTAEREHTDVLLMLGSVLENRGLFRFNDAFTLVSAVNRLVEHLTAVERERDEWKQHCDKAIDVRQQVECQYRSNLQLRERQLAAIEARERALVAERDGWRTANGETREKLRLTRADVRALREALEVEAKNWGGVGMVNAVDVRSAFRVLIALVNATPAATTAPALFDLGPPCLDCGVKPGFTHALECVAVAPDPPRSAAPAALGLPSRMVREGRMHNGHRPNCNHGGLLGLLGVQGACNCDYEEPSQPHTAPPVPVLTAEEREAGGKLVRGTWMRWARQQPDCKPSWVIPWEQMEERDREVDRLIYEARAEPQGARLAHTAPPVRTAEEQIMLTFLLNRIRSWTTARWDQHLRNEYGDERAQPVIDSFAAAMRAEKGE